jgi:hypothetical protein
MKRPFAVMGCVLMILAGFSCSYHRAYISYSEYEEDVQVAAAGWEGQRLGPVSAGEGGALWEKCTDVAEGSLWILMEDARRMGGNAIGEIRWIPQNRNRTTDRPSCKKKWGWILIWPVLATPAFMSARVEAVAYNVPDTAVTEPALHRIPDDPREREVLARRIVADTFDPEVAAGNLIPFRHRCRWETDECLVFRESESTPVRPATDSRLRSSGD